MTTTPDDVRMTGWSNLPSAPTELALTLSVVICAYTPRRWRDLCRSAESVLSQGSTVMELIVVIDHCEELFDAASGRFEGDERVSVRRNEEANGLSGARNTGVAAARGDVIAFLDDDASADVDWARRLMKHYRDPRVAVIGGFAAAVWTGSRPSWMPAEFDWVVGCSYSGQPTRLAPVRNPIGCNMAIRRSVFDVVGGFRAEVGRVGSTPVGGEETEFCIRAGSAPTVNRILFDPELTVQHAVSADRETLRYFVRRCYHEGMSKAVVSDLAAGAAPLSTERDYVRNVLPRAIAREVASASVDGSARAAVIVLGVAVTAAGYVRARVSRRTQGSMR